MGQHASRGDGLQAGNGFDDTESGDRCCTGATWGGSFVEIRNFLNLVADIGFGLGSSSNLVQVLFKLFNF